MKIIDYIDLEEAERIKQAKFESQWREKNKNPKLNKPQRWSFRRFKRKSFK